MKKGTQEYRRYRVFIQDISRHAFFVLVVLLINMRVFVHAQTKKEPGMTTAKAENSTVASTDEKSIRTLMNRFVTAFNAGDIDAIMKNYVPDKNLVVFDVVPRKEYHGAEAYRED